MTKVRRVGLYLLSAWVVAVAGTSAQGPVASPVADAASHGDLNAVRALLKQGADVNTPRPDGMTALHWAAERGDAAMAEMLLYAGANVTAGTRIGQYTPLHLASRNGSTAVIRALLAAGASPDVRTSTSGVTPLHLAAESGSVGAVTALIEKGADVNAKESEWDQTPLIFATESNRTDVIKVLIQHGAKVDARTKSVDLQKQSAADRQAAALQRQILAASVPKGQTPTPTQMQTAIEAMREFYTTGKAPEPTAAAGAGAGGGRGGRGAGGAGAAPTAAPVMDPNTLGSAGLDQTPAAGQGGAQAAIDRLNQDGPAPQISAKGGLTALHHAVRQGYVESTRVLLDAGADVNEKTGDGHTPLLVALINGQFDVAMELINRGADVNIASDSHGVTPLWAAVNAMWQPRTRFPQPQEMERQQATYLDVMKALLDKGADVNARIRVHPWYMVYTDCGNANCGLTNAAGSTAFWRAAYATDVDAMRLLVKYGADPNIPTLNAARGGGRGFGGGAGGRGGGGGGAAAAGRGGGAGGRGAGPVTDGAVPPDQAPLPAGGDQSGLPPVPAGGPGTWPIDAASGSEYGEGFAGNAHRHAPDAWVAAVKYLVEELGADVNARDAQGYTPLHNAAARGDNDLIKYLVSKGADVKAVSRRGQTTADMANGPVSRISPYPDTIALLESLGSKNNHRCQSCVP
ncbi:MAG TPA: ankyrin repeat domain-containing protein [Vicinamibacterales bacterium]|nr:ankyrin repeat domain-containing protein [Vicinamibacterales bacterium]